MQTLENPTGHGRHDDSTSKSTRDLLHIAAEQGQAQIHRIAIVGGLRTELAAGLVKEVDGALPALPENYWDKLHQEVADNPGYADVAKLFEANHNLVSRLSQKIERSHINEISAEEAVEWYMHLGPNVEPSVELESYMTKAALAILLDRSNRPNQKLTLVESNVETDYRSLAAQMLSEAAWFGLTKEHNLDHSMQLSETAMHLYSNIINEVRHTNRNPMEVPISAQAIAYREDLYHMIIHAGQSDSDYSRQMIAEVRERLSQNDSYIGLLNTAMSHGDVGLAVEYSSMYLLNHARNSQAATDTVYARKAFMREDMPRYFSSGQWQAMSSSDRAEASRVMQKVRNNFRSSFDIVVYVAEYNDDDQKDVVDIYTLQLKASHDPALNSSYFGGVDVIGFNEFEPKAGADGKRRRFLTERLHDALHKRRADQLAELEGEFFTHPYFQTSRGRSLRHQLLI